MPGPRHGTRGDGPEIPAGHARPPRRVRDPARPACRAGLGYPHQFLWFRLAAPIDSDEVLRRVVLTYASDFALVSTAILPHSKAIFSPGMQVASLDHAVWFHSTPPVDDWLLYAMDSPW
ncbi:hypothetical protein ACFSLT_00825 [Novosphingobium resinovorum]